MQIQLALASGGYLVLVRQRTTWALHADEKTKMRYRVPICFAVAFILLSVQHYRRQLQIESLSFMTLSASPLHLKKDWGFSAFVEYNGKRILLTPVTTRYLRPERQSIGY